MSGKPTFRGKGNPGTRLAEEPLPHLDAYKTQLVPDMAPNIQAFDKAHAVMLVEREILPKKTGVAILKGLRAIEKEGVLKARVEAGGGIHSGEHYLTHKYGAEIGGRLHLGRSSGDLQTVGLRLTIRDQIHRLLTALSETRRTLIELAPDHLETVMAGNTHGQHAQPTTFAHWLLMFEAVFARDTERLLSFHSRLNRSPAGAAIMTGSDFPLDRERVAALLGFDAPMHNTLDAILSHDLEMEYSGVLLVAAQSISRLADDLMLWSTFEYGLVELPDRYCGTSSIMPQKKNPDGMEDMRSLGAQAVATAGMVAMIERGPTGFPIMERRNSHHMLFDLARGMALRFETVPPLFRDLKVNVERMRKLAGANWAQATDIAGALVRHAGMDWRTSDHVIGGFVRRCIDKGITPETATSADLDAASIATGHKAPKLSAKIFAEVMDPMEFVRRRQLLGGPAPKVVTRQIAGSRKRLVADEKSIALLKTQAQKAHDALEAAIDGIVKA